MLEGWPRPVRPELLTICDSAKHLDHAMRKVVDARYVEDPAEAIIRAAETHRSGDAWPDGKAVS
jgi:hypothetical protein